MGGLQAESNQPEISAVPSPLSVNSSPVSSMSHLVPQFSTRQSYQLGPSLGAVVPSSSFGIGTIALSKPNSSPLRASSHSCLIVSVEPLIVIELLHQLGIFSLPHNFSFNDVGMFKGVVAL